MVTPNQLTQPIRTLLRILVVAAFITGCTGDDVSTDDDSVAVFTQGNPLVIEENPSPGILGQLPGGNTGSGITTTGTDTSGEGSTSGSVTSGGDTAGNETAGSDSAGNNTTGNNTAGNSTDGGSTVGNETAGDNTAGGSTTGSQNEGGSTAGNETAGATTSGNETAGSSTAGNETPGGSTSGTEADGGSTTGNETAGASTSGNESAGGGGTSGGDTTGNETDGNGTDSNPVGLVPLDSQSDLTLAVADPIETIEFDGVEIDQVFNPAQTSYTASAGYLVTSAEVSVNGAAPLSVDLGAENNLVQISSDASGLTYSFDISRESADAFMQQAYIKDTQGRQNSEFGTAVAIDGDYIAVLGRNAEQRVTVFHRSGGVWTVQAVIPVNGNSIDLHDGYLAIGDTTARGRDIEGFGTGLVSLYKRNQISWEFSRTVVAPYPDEGDQFGYAVSLQGATLAVGAPRENSNATGINGNGADNSALDAGAVYIFARDAFDDWTNQAYLKGAATDGGDKFGISVDLSLQRLAVGAIGEESAANSVNGNQQDEGMFGSGAAYIFQRLADGQWIQEAYLKPQVPGVNDLFGSSVVIDGETLAVSAISEDSSATGLNGDAYDNSASHAGAVYVFQYAASEWRQQAYVKASNTDDGDRFGSALALQGNTLVVGAPFEDSNSAVFNDAEDNNARNNSGAVYVFNQTGASWQQVLYIHAANADAADHFSADGAVALDQGTLLIGAPGESSRSRVNDQQALDNSQPRAGAAYVFR